MKLLLYFFKIQLPYGQVMAKSLSLSGHGHVMAKSWSSHDQLMAKLFFLLGQYLQKAILSIVQIDRQNPPKSSSKQISHQELQLPIE